MALGRSPDIALNHNGPAIAMHRANHPETHHLLGDIWDADPLLVTRGRHVGLLWGSFDCRHFSRCKQGQPLSKRVRALAWALTRWGACPTPPRTIFAENVIIDPVVNGKRLSVSEQVHKCGNSVPPPVAEALVRANFGDMLAMREAA